MLNYQPADVAENEIYLKELLVMINLPLNASPAVYLHTYACYHTRLVRA